MRFFVCFCSCGAWRRDIGMEKLGHGAREGGDLFVRKEQNGRGGGISVARKVRGGLRGGRNAGEFLSPPERG